MPLFIPGAPALAASPEQPNVVIIFLDDLGYGDLTTYGHPTILTPNLDRMATEGLKFTQFYSASAACTPARAALLTGRYPPRSGMNGVIGPSRDVGMPPEEITLAEALKERGYATAMVGKWHLGHLSPHLPTDQGFDSYFGIPYSHDMNRQGGRFNEPPIPLMRGTEIIEQPVDPATLTRRYTEESLRFIREHRDGPFFLYLAHSMPHVPIAAAEPFLGRSARGLYGDVVEELDWSVGELLAELRRLGIAENTFVFFTSDNGPWLIKGLDGGSSGLLREGKGTTWEGGFRVPGIAWWPGTIPGARVTTALASTMDLFTTAIRLAGGEPPSDRVIDGIDISPLLRGEGEQGRDELAYHYHGGEGALYAYRLGPWKIHFITQQFQNAPRVEHDPPALYQLEHDPSEKHDVSADHPDIVARVREAARRHAATINPNQE